MRGRRQKRLRHEAASVVVAELQAESLQDAAASGSQNPELAAEIEAIRGITRLLGEVPTEARSPSAVSVAAIAQEPRARTGLKPEAPAENGHRRPMRRSRAVAAIAAAACLAVGFAGGAIVESANSGSGSNPQNAVPRGASVPLRPLGPQSGSSLAVAYMPGGDQMVLRVAHLPPSPPGTYYELWLMTNLRHLAPVAAFKIGADGRAQLRLLLPDNSARYLYLDISRQQIGGGTGHSADSVLRGKLS